MSERVVSLRPGDVFSETLHREGQMDDTTLLYKVRDVNTDRNGKDYVWVASALDESGVPSCMTLYLEKGEKKGKKARLPQVFSTENTLVHTINKVKAPKGTKWSYEH